MHDRLPYLVKMEYQGPYLFSAPTNQKAYKIYEMKNSSRHWTSSKKEQWLHREGKPTNNVPLKLPKLTIWKKMSRS